MAGNRLLYLAVLCGALVFYFISGVWTSWILLLLVVFLPVLSLILSLPGMLGTRIFAACPEQTMLGQTVEVGFSLSGPRLAPLFFVRVRVHTANSWDRDGEKTAYRFSLDELDTAAVPLEAVHCGTVSAYVDCLYLYDALGLFCRRKKNAAQAVCVVTPPELEPERHPNLERLAPLRLVVDPAAEPGEEYDIREYRPGDPARSIHWKLSGKTNRLMIRESVSPVRRHLALTVTTQTDSSLRDYYLANMRWLSSELLRRGQEHTLVWMRSGDLRRADISSAAALETAVTEMCRDLPWSGTVSRDELEHGQLLYTVPEGEGVES